MVRSLKISIGRARPDSVLNDRMPFSNWYEMGPFFLGDGSFSGSFPSGHTAQSFIPMALAICLVAFPDQTKRLRGTGYLLGGVALVYSMTMAVGRCMNASHWLSDVCASILLSGLFYYLMYYYLFNVPQQATFYLNHGAHAPLPVAWEMRICGLIICVVSGVVASVTGLRAIILEKPVVLWLLLPCGALWTAWFLWRTLKYHARVTSVLHDV